MRDVTKLARDTAGKALVLAMGPFPWEGETVRFGTLGKPTGNPDRATAILTIANRGTAIALRRRDAGWRVVLSERNLNLFPEDNVGTFDKERDRDRNQSTLLPPVEAITKQAFDAAWMTSVDFKNRPGKDVLAQVAQEAGLIIFDQPEFIKLLM